MTVKTQIVKGKYLDSVKLMLVSKELREQNGVADAVAILANKENREILAVTDMLLDEIKSAAETDIVIVIKADSEEHAEAALNKAESLLKAPSGKARSGEPVARNIRSALQNMDGAELCLISVAGKYAAAEAKQALESGLHVMIFSDNMSLADELKLKQQAAAQGLLMMGPDCGTAIINGCPLGFANQIPPGKIGIVSAAGTGLQEVSVAIAHRGFGVSQAIGTGGRDGKQAIGGIMLGAGLEYLLQDKATDVLIMIAKTPDPSVREQLWQQISVAKKAVVVNFLQETEHPTLPNLHVCSSLEESAVIACKLHCQQSSQTTTKTTVAEIALPELAADRKYLVGLYSGGTLCYEAQQLYFQYFNEYPCSNTPLKPEYASADPWNHLGDCFTDLGSDEFTVGRAHPMIDYSLRMKMLEHIGKRADVALIILDIVLGYGANPDPAAELLPVLAQIAPQIPIVCHVLGTVDDPQNAEVQADKLRKAGVKVFISHHAAADYAMRALQQQRRKR